MLRVLPFIDNTGLQQIPLCRLSAWMTGVDKHPVMRLLIRPFMNSLAVGMPPSSSIENCRVYRVSIQFTSGLLTWLLSDN
jgi:hypothetical protein